MTILLNPDCLRCGCRGLGRAYVGGHFTTIGGEAHARLAMVDRSGVAVSGFVCTLAGGDPEVLYLDEPNGLLWVGGDFTTVNGVAHAGLVAVDWNTGAVVYAPTLTGTVLGSHIQLFGFRYDAASGFLYICGDFLVFNGTACFGAVRVALGASPALDTTWLPVLDGPPQNTSVLGSTVYITGGFFATLNGAARGGAGAVDIATGLVSTAWDPCRAGGAVDVMARSVDSVIITGNFSRINPGPPGTLRRRLAEVDGNTGAATSWNPGDEILNGVGLRLEPAGANSFFVAGSFTTVAGGSAPAYVAEFLYAGVVDPTFRHALVTTRCNQAHIGTDGRLYVCMDGGALTDRGIFALSVVDGSTYTDWLPTPDGECYCVTTSSTLP